MSNELTFQETAEYLGVKVSTIATYVDKEILPVTAKNSGLIPVEAVMEYEKKRGDGRHEAARKSARTRKANGPRPKLGSAVVGLYKVRGLVQAMDTMDHFDADLLLTELGNLERELV